MKKQTTNPLPETTQDKILLAIQLLYKDVYKTSDKQQELSDQLTEIKSLLVNILQYQKDLETFEKKVFIDHLKSHVKEPS